MKIIRVSETLFKNVTRRRFRDKRSETRATAKRTGQNGLSLDSNYFNNEALLGTGNKGFLDVVNHSNKTIYDFKFGNAIMSNSQHLKYSNNFPGYGIQIIDKSLW